ncbi:MAG: tRNA adenosine(34) deaminase TadA [Clostridiales bacterium]|uniref:tRNA-specific adenosine deaminase n=1 Tax=Intestinimonas massiliensis (ex Afouda et al. 2020) TaxID=1673721 RepID=A0ABS9M5C6_9FIRM|nr:MULTISPECIES: tRNA adenosine(34) deaminase TadA [Intestinimonas]MDU1325388.1 tRNA adenosine(34) deaminase TadA [Clostridiales bacterium]MCG4525984.1 tRNA adenosine(34) deaminase TadA [Intestinimonas massiliensis (ex Afouda et al. 2020)]MCI5563525.1 tRNA adenosine(34) deaminase TadA [Intestinimonas massiliensis (ex Afouda et al. 2020)]MCQ4805504.1 tRNA adenosine(34) deaminase TadA [Intestinimonas massiliensis (ex Afouda et al. 2020)]MDY5338479.1 tRNA adenosine(34) deaminase TadA [Intestinimo
MEREEYMRQALALAEEAAGHGDVPVGCVVVKDGAVIGRGCNRREERGDAVAHAEVEAIRQACRAVGGWNLHDCALYVTLEPCPMCAGAIINARVGTVCYGARDEKAGACGSVLDLFAERFNHRPRVYGGVLKEECAALLQDFFHDLRKNSPDFPQN